MARSVACDYIIDKYLVGSNHNELLLIPLHHSHNTTSPGPKGYLFIVLDQLIEF